MKGCGGVGIEHIPCTPGRHRIKKHSSGLLDCKIPQHSLTRLTQGAGRGAGTAIPGLC
jgi:hypothetical protein